MFVVLRVNTVDVKSVFSFLSLFILLIYSFFLTYALVRKSGSIIPLNLYNS